MHRPLFPLLLLTTMLAACGTPPLPLPAKRATVVDVPAARRPENVGPQPTVRLEETALDSAAVSESQAWVDAGERALQAASSVPAATTFPAGFLWGAATAAHQVEGHLDNDWIAFEGIAGNVKNGDTSTVGVDSYHRFDEDFGLAADMGHNAHRLSVEWSRIEPRRGEWDATAIAHYHEVFRSLRAHGLKPMVTLLHFTQPNWVAAQGGWLSDKTRADFAQFASFMGLEYGAEVDDWITLNEPNVYAFNAYDSGIWPPQHKNREEALQAMANLAMAHADAYHALHAADRGDADGDGIMAEVGFAHHIALFDPYRRWHPVDLVTAYFNDKVFNRAFLKAVTTGEVAFSIPGSKGVKKSYPSARNAVDFVGINHYMRWMCKGSSERRAKDGAPTTGMGWENYPEGLYRSLKLANEYTHLPDGRRLPVIITESGIDDRGDGATRNPYMVRTLGQVARAIKDGVDVRGYIHWTLMDNFEWAEGYEPKFGLYHVDRTTGNSLRRSATPSVALFRDITAANGLTQAMVDQYK